MKPEIILHVGTEKTGSTSIQSLFHASYETLLKAGVLFPRSLGTPCHIHLTACALEKEPQHPIRCLLGIQSQSDFADFVRKTKLSLKEEIEKNSPTTLVISDEHINVHLSNIKSLCAFKNLCEEFGEIKAVVIYLRQQDEFRLSLFSEAVKSGNLSHFNLLNPLPVFDSIPYRFNYLAILNNLGNIFGKDFIIPRIYDRSSFPEGNVCADFLNISGIHLSAGASINSNTNQSIDATIIKHLALISSSLKGLSNDWSEKLRGVILRNCQKIFTGAGPVLRKENHKMYLAQFAPHNDLIKQKYFKSIPEQGDLFPNYALEEVANKPIYPDCTIPWEEFFIKYVSETMTNFSMIKTPEEDENIIKSGELNKIKNHDDNGVNKKSSSKDTASKNQIGIVNDNISFTLSEKTPFTVKNSNIIKNILKQKTVAWRHLHHVTPVQFALVVQCFNKVTFEPITIGSGHYLTLKFGAGLKQISDDGLDIRVSFVSATTKDAQEIFFGHLENTVTTSSWQDASISLAFLAGQTGSIQIFCGPGPRKNPNADWLAILELHVCSLEQVTLSRARMHNELHTKN